jgi:hypothetical protein
MYSPSLFKRTLFMSAFALSLNWQCAGAEPAHLAELLATETTDAGLSVTVPTGGCTQKSDFEVTARAAKNGRASVEIRRLKRDSCKGNFPEGLKLVFTWDDLKLPANTKLGVKNPVNAPAQRGQITPQPSGAKQVRVVSGTRSIQTARVRERVNSTHQRRHKAQATVHRQPRWHHARMHQASWSCVEDSSCRRMVRAKSKAHRPRWPMWPSC